MYTCPFILVSYKNYKIFKTLFENQDTSSLLSTFSTLLNNTSHCCSIEFQPCITTFLDQNIISDSINQELPREQQQLLTNMLLTHGANLRELNDSIFVFTKKGYEDFVQNGIIYQIPSELYHPLSVKDRITILNRLLQSNQSGQSKFCMMKEDSFYPQMEIFTYDSTSLLFNCILPGKSDARTCIIKEPNIISAFNDFIRNLSNHNLIYNSEQTSEIFKNSILDLKNDTSPPSNNRSQIDKTGTA